MGWNDNLDDSELSNLPPEAFSPFGSRFDPDNRWLENAGRDDQITAVREWFYARFCDPAHETPYNGKEGGYLFIDGGPFDPAEVLPERFSGLVDDETIQEVIDQLHAENGDQWAPVRDRRMEEYEYDERFDFLLRTRDEPFVRLHNHLQQAQGVLRLQGDVGPQSLAQQLVFSAAITALETFLYETVTYWIDSDEGVLRNIVTKIPALRDQDMKLGEVFGRYAGLKEEVKGYLQNLVWHRWDKVAQLVKLGLEIQPPSFRPIEAALIKRHDIVHRNGHDKSGKPIFVSLQEIYDLCHEIEKFAAEIDAQLLAREKSKN